MPRRHNSFIEGSPSTASSHFLVTEFVLKNSGNFLKMNLLLKLRLGYRNYTSRQVMWHAFTCDDGFSAPRKFHYRIAYQIVPLATEHYRKATNAHTEEQRRCTRVPFVSAPSLAGRQCRQIHSSMHARTKVPASPMVSANAATNWSTIAQRVWE